VLDAFAELLFDEVAAGFFLCVLCVLDPLLELCAYPTVIAADITATNTTNHRNPEILFTTAS